MAFESGKWAYRRLPENYTRKKKSKFGKWPLFLFIVLTFSFLFNWFIRSYLMFPVQFANQSMEPRFSQGSILFFSYFIGKVDRNNIVYIRSKKSRSSLVCRIIGLPEERIHIKNGYVYINSEKLLNEQPIISSKIKLPHDILPRDNRAPEIIQKGHYFCLFDNRSLMNDSRSWGSFPRSEIIGTAHSEGILGLRGVKEK